MACRTVLLEGVSLSIYFGSYGRMVALKCPATQQVQQVSEPSIVLTVEGKPKAQVPFLTPRRSWALGTSDATTPQDQAAIMSFANGAWGRGPFWFVSTDAPVTNLLTPTAAECLDPYQAGVANAGPVNLGTDGWAAESLRPTGVTPPREIYTQFERIPVLSGVPVTGSAWVQGEGAMVRIYWTNDADAVIGAINSPTIAAADGIKRVHITSVPPAGATGMRLIAYDATRVAAPAVTWTSEPFPRSDGQGCPRAILHSASRSLVLSSRDPRGGRYSNLSYTITEVG